MKLCMLLFLLQIVSALARVDEGRDSSFLIPTQQTPHDSTQRRELYHGRRNTRRWRRLHSPSAMVSVNPTKIFSLLMDSGLFIPEDVKSDVAVLRRVCSADKAKLNLLDKKLVLHNLCIGVRRHKPALRIGLAVVHWDSYQKPSLDVKVEDVDVFVAFSNLLLTRSNWNELKEAGFPPKLKTRRRRHRDSFIRFRDVDLSGNITVRISSRPLDREMDVVVMEMDRINDLGLLIRRLSRRRYLLSRRRGCTPEELATLLRKHFDEKINRFVSRAASDITKDPGKAFRTASRHAQTSSDIDIKCASAAGQTTWMDGHEALVTRTRGAVERIDKGRKQPLMRNWQRRFHRVTALIAKKTGLDNNEPKVREEENFVARQVADTESPEILFTDW